MSPKSFIPPEKLRDDHDLSLFECGEPALDDWLRRRALQNEESGASRTLRRMHTPASGRLLCIGRWSGRARRRPRPRPPQHA